MLERTVANSKTEQVHLIKPTHLNGGHRLFGGSLLNWIDEVAAITAMRHTINRAYIVLVALAEKS